MHEADQLKDYISSEALKECLEIQRTSSNNRSLFIIAIEQGYINDKTLAKIVKNISPKGQEKESRTPPKKKFGEYCVEKGFASQAQVDECIAIQSKLKKEGKHFRIGQILIEKKYVAFRQAQYILEMQGKKIMRCESCDTKFNIRNYKSNKKYKCPKCGDLLSSSINSVSVGVNKSIVNKETVEIDDEAVSLSGRKIGDYEITELLGEGGMADVYKVTSPFKRKPRALKIMKASAGMERFTREFESAHALRHPHIVRVYETGNLDNRPYFFMEYLDGGSLDKRIEKMGVIPLLEGLTILKQVTMGLKYAHENKIVHRDIKPNNILLTRGSRRELIAKITDFGIARAVNDSHITVTGQLVGTFKYMAPEYIKGLGVDGNNDIFSLGITAFEMFTGKEPFTVDEPIGYLFVNIKENVTPIHQENPDLPKELTLIVNKMVAKDPRNRYNSGELLRDLDRLYRFLQNGEKLQQSEDKSSVFYENKKLFVIKNIWDKISQKISGTETEVIVEAKEEEEVDYENLSQTVEVDSDERAKEMYQWGLTRIQKGDYDEAIKTFFNIVKSYPKSSSAESARKKIKAIRSRKKKEQLSKAQKKK